jgi:hypothetical protein
MSVLMRAQRIGVIALAMLGGFALSNAIAQAVTSDRTVRAVRYTLERLPGSSALQRGTATID